MRPLTREELERMQITQEAAMIDTCVLMRYSETPDALNHPVPTWSDGPFIECGVDMGGGTEARETEKTAVSWYAKLRLPLGTQFDLRDRIRLVARFGQPTEDLTVYEFSGPAQIGPSGIVVPFKKVEPSL